MLPSLNLVERSLILEYPDFMSEFLGASLFFLEGKHPSPQPSGRVYGCTYLCKTLSEYAYKIAWSRTAEEDSSQE